METNTTITTHTISPHLTQEARYFLAAIVESSNDSIVTIDFNSVITTWNKGAEHLYGYSAAEVVGKSLTVVTLPEDLKQLLVNIDRIKDSKKVERYETIRIHKQGRRMYLEIELSPVLNDAGDVIGVSTFARDITRRKRIEADLAFLAEVSKELVDLTDIEVTMTSVCGKIGNYFDLAYCQFMEINERQDVGAVSYGWQREGTPNIPAGREFTDFITPDFAKRARAGEVIIVRDVRTDPIANGEKMVALKIGSFITVPMVRNDVWLSWFGFYNSHARDWVTEEIELMRELTTRIWVRLERARAEEALRQNEEKLRELTARLQKTDKAKTAFFNNVTHEFRTPLTLLLGPIEELIKSGESKFTTGDMQKLQFAYRSATRLQKLVTALLDFARIEAAKIEAYYQPTDLSKLTTELASNFRSAIEKAGLKYIVKIEQISDPVYLNRDMWEKIVFNLLSNAFKFTHKGKIEVIVRDKKKKAELRVRDTGVGIAQKDIDRIFERFTRIEGTHARTNEGTGIGLALVRELVLAHGGVIKVKSVQGTGSEFIVSIPKGKAHFAAHQIFENRDRLPVQDIKQSFVGEILGWLPEDVKNSKKILKQYQKDCTARILVVDDNADMRDYLAAILSEEDYKIFPMEDGQKVIEFLEGGGQADLILADIMMPVLNGLDMTRKLKANQKFTDIPVILLTAKTAEDSKIEGLHVGADAYLTKPFSAKELRAVILSSLARKASVKSQ